jgi:hypothetical protein
MTNQITNAVTGLSGVTDNDLKAKLGAYAMQFPSAPADYAEPGADVAITGDVASITGDAIDLGTRILKRWNKVLYDLVCGAGEDVDPEVRKKILDATNLKSPEAIAAAITATLIGVFSVGPAIATIVGVLLGRVLLPAAGKEICSFWKEKL